MSPSPPPAAHGTEASVKRKRRTSDTTTRLLPALHIGTADPSDGRGESGADSPRTRVAERFQDLEIRHARGSSPPGSRIEVNVSAPAHAAGDARKRLKRMSPGVRSESDASANWRDESTNVVGGSEELQNYARREVPDVRGPSKGDQKAMGRKGDSSPEARGLHTPPSSSPVIADFDSNHGSSCPDGRAPTLDRAALTWKDSEITGHDIDPTSPDDDGEGINGIGFKPTPALEYARRQKRKQQVNEWKAREAREARQKRLDRRIRKSGPEGFDFSPVDAAAGSEGKRMVRFVGTDRG